MWQEPNKQESLPEQRELIRNVVMLTESIRVQRKMQFQVVTHGEGKKFTQEELSQTVYPSYKNLLLQATYRLPSRAALLQIADYLECTLTQRNELLVTAQYLPEAVQLEGAALEDAVRKSIDLMHSLPFPAYVLAEACEVVAANQQFHAMSALGDLYQLAREERNPLHFLCNPELPIRERLTPSFAEWQENVVCALTLFRELTYLLRYESWYVELVRQAEKLPDFLKVWQSHDSKQHPTDSGTIDLEGYSPRFQKKVPVRLLAIRLTTAVLPVVIGVMPSNRSQNGVPAISLVTMG